MCESYLQYRLCISNAQYKTLKYNHRDDLQLQHVCTYVYIAIAKQVAHSPAMLKPCTHFIFTYFIFNFQVQGCTAHQSPTRAQCGVLDVFFIFFRADACVERYTSVIVPVTARKAYPYLWRCL